MSLHYLVKLEMLVGATTVRERNSRNYPTSTVAPKFARFECSWLQRVETIAREGVQNTHHWSGRLKQRLRTEWSKVAAVASLIVPD